MEIPKEVIRHFGIQAEIENQGDRGAAIIATSYLDERLREALRAAFSDGIEEAKEGSETVEARLFEGTGPVQRSAARSTSRSPLASWAPSRFATFT